MTSMSWYVYGILAAVALGTYNFLYALIPKGISSSTILMGVGMGLAVMGILIKLLSRDATFVPSQLKWPILIGLVLGIGIFMVTKAFLDPNIRVSQLVPLININALVCVFLGLVILKEYQTAPLLKVIIGTILILLGAVVIK